MPGNLAQAPAPVGKAVYSGRTQTKGPMQTLQVTVPRVCLLPGLSIINPVEPLV